jgi:hypothetical protein
MRITTVILFLLFISIPLSSYAEWERSGSIGLSSRYVGVTQSILNNGPVIQPNLHFTETQSNNYVDAFGTFGINKPENNEIDLAVGAKKQVGQFTITGEMAVYTFLQPRLYFFAPILTVRHTSGFYVGTEGRFIDNKKGLHLETGYCGSMFETSFCGEIRRIDFYGDHFSVGRLNISHKLGKDIAVSITLATPLSTTQKKSTAVVSISSTF